MQLLCQNPCIILMHVKIKHRNATANEFQDRYDNIRSLSTLMLDQIMNGIPRNSVRHR